MKTNDLLNRINFRNGGFDETVKFLSDENLEVIKSSFKKAPSIEIKYTLDSGILSNKPLALLTIDEAIRYLSIKRTEIDKLLKSGELKCFLRHERVLFTYNQLNDYIRTNCSSNKAMCLKTNNHILARNFDFAVYEIGKTYYIYKENKLWVYLFCDFLIRFRRKDYNSYFRNAEKIEIDAEIYKLS